MLKLSIPGFHEEIELRHLVLDFNGTLAIDGRLIDGVKEELIRLSGFLEIHILTGNTFGSVIDELKDISFRISVLQPQQQNFEKGKYVTELGGNSVISIGNGENDCSMLQLSAIGIAVIQHEGASVKALMAADIVCTSILHALDLIRHPLRLKATLRS